MPAPESLATALRSATRELHHCLDHHPVLAPLVRNDISRKQYVTALSGLLRIVRPMEQALATYIARHHPTFDYGKRRRAEALASDIEQFGQALPESYWQAATINNDAQLVGNLYVLEGSTLGGRVIFKQLQMSLGVERDRGGRYFYGHGEQSDAMWLGFWRFAEPLCPVSSHPEAQQAACRLFASYLDVLEGESLV